MTPIIDCIRAELVRRGWRVDAGATENTIGEVADLIEPLTDKRYAWLDAVLLQAGLEDPNTQLPDTEWTCPTCGNNVRCCAKCGTF